MGIFETPEPSIGEALAGCGAQSVKQLGESSWKLSFSNGEAFDAVAMTDEDWLAVEVQNPAAQKRPSSRLGQLWDFLALNPLLPGGVKYALMPKDRGPRIRVELPLEEGACPAGAIRLAALGLKVAFHRLNDKAQADDATDPKPTCPAETEAADEKGDDLSDLCNAAGWKFAKRASGRLAVELEAPANPCQAIVEHRGAGIAAAVELAACEGLGRESRHAAALMLLTACGLVRMVRATASRTDARTALGYEVAMGVGPTAGQLGRALSALSVACGFCGQQELAAMQDESIAQRYLSVRGWSS